MTLNSVSLALVLTFIPSSVMAQTDPVQEPGLELVTDRPDQTESSVVIPPPGYFQLETGWGVTGSGGTAPRSFPLLCFALESSLQWNCGSASTAMFGRQRSPSRAQKRENWGLSSICGPKGAGFLKRACFFPFPCRNGLIRPFGRTGAFVEVLGDLPLTRRGRPGTPNLDGDLTYLLRDNLQLDAFFGIGLSRAADDWLAGTGVTLRLPR